jgi:hypothetical protein
MISRTELAASSRVERQQALIERLHTGHGQRVHQRRSVSISLCVPWGSPEGECKYWLIQTTSSTYHKMT